jgi:hypothetical protein
LILPIWVPRAYGLTTDTQAAVVGDHAASFDE